MVNGTGIQGYGGTRVKAASRQRMLRTDHAGGKAPAEGKAGGQGKGQTPSIQKSGRKGTADREWGGRGAKNIPSGK